MTKYLCVTCQCLRFSDAASALKHLEASPDCFLLEKDEGMKANLKVQVAAQGKK